jgi:hypothetical protein
MDDHEYDVSSVIDDILFGKDRVALYILKFAYMNRIFPVSVFRHSDIRSNPFLYLSYIHH